VTEDEADAVALAHARAVAAREEREARTATVDLPPEPAAPSGPWWHGVLAGLAYGVLMVLALPPAGLWILALAAPLPLAWLVERTTGRSGRRGLWAALGVLPFWLFEQVWVMNISAAGYLPMCAYLSMYTWALVWACGRIRQRFPTAPLAVIFPAVWIAVDFLRGEIAFHGYPWYYVSHPLIDAASVAWIAALLGVYAVTWLVVAVAAAAIDLRSIDRKRQKTAMVTLGAAAAVVVVGVGWNLVAGSNAGPLARVAVVQTNIPQDNKNLWTGEQKTRDWARFEDLMTRAASEGARPDLIVLPETMFPGPTLDPRSLLRDREQNLSVNSVDPPQPTTYFADRLQAIQQRLGAPVLIGALGYDEFRWLQTRDASWIRVYKAVYNSALLVDDGRVLEERYDKLHLTPFGEEMPYFSAWPWLQRQLLSLGAEGMAFELSRGRGPVVLQVGCRDGRVLRVATPICFEATMAELCRSLVFKGGERRADLLINLSNDGWFGGWDAGRRQHLQLARWRCLELGTPMVRAANTGISALIDTRGRIVKAGVVGSANPARVDGVLVVDVPRPGPVTLYARVGDLFGATAGLVAGIMFVLTFGLAARLSRITSVLQRLKQ
jgi:apolipoprotein N-acyltransferase